MAREDGGADEDFSPVSAARQVLRGTATGALATLHESGSPFASFVTVASASDGEPILLLSALAAHTRNLKRDSRASLLLVAPGGETGDPLAGARLTVTGRVVRTDENADRRRFLARHSEAEGYAGFGDFAVYRLAVESGHLVAGFGRIVALGRGALLTDCSDCGDLLKAEESAIAHMNADHADALALYAQTLCGMPAGAWIMTGCDPDGIDLRAGALRARLAFPDKVRTGEDLRRTLAALSRTARAGAG